MDSSSRSFRPSAFDDRVPADNKLLDLTECKGPGRRAVPSSSRSPSEPATPMRRRENQLFDYFEVVLENTTIDLRSTEDQELQSEFKSNFLSSSGIIAGDASIGAPVTATPPPINSPANSSSSTLAGGVSSSTSPQAGRTGRWRSPSKQGTGDASGGSRSPLLRRSNLVSPSLAPSRNPWDASSSMNGVTPNLIDTNNMASAATDPSVVPVSGNFKFRLSDDILFHKVVLEFACIEHAPLFQGALPSSAVTLKSLPTQSATDPDSSGAALVGGDEDGGGVAAHFRGPAGAFAIDETKANIIGKKGTVNATSCSLLHHAHLTLLGYLEESTLLQDVEDGDNNKFQQCIRTTAAVALAAAKKNGRPSEVASLSAQYIKRNRRALRNAMKPEIDKKKAKGPPHDDDDEFVTGPPPQELPAGDYNFPFCFDLPRHLPSSAAAFFNSANSCGIGDTKAMVEEACRKAKGGKLSPMIEYVIKASIVYYTEVQEDPSETSSFLDPSTSSTNEADKLLGRKLKEVVQEIRVVSQADASQLWKETSACGGDSSAMQSRRNSLPSVIAAAAAAAMTGTTSSNNATSATAARRPSNPTLSGSLVSATGANSKAKPKSTTASLQSTTSNTTDGSQPMSTRMKGEYPFSSADYVVYRVATHADPHQHHRHHAALTSNGGKKKKKPSGFWSSVFCQSRSDVKQSGGGGDDDGSRQQIPHSTAEDLMVIRCTLDADANVLNNNNASSSNGFLTVSTSEGTPIADPEGHAEASSPSKEVESPTVAVYVVDSEVSSNERGRFAGTPLLLSRGDSTLMQQPPSRLRSTSPSCVVSPTSAKSGGFFGGGGVEVIRGVVRLQHFVDHLKTCQHNEKEPHPRRCVPTRRDNGVDAERDGGEVDPTRCCNNTFNEMAKFLRAAVYVYSVTLVPVKAVQGPPLVEKKVKPSKRGCCQASPPPSQNPTDMGTVSENGPMYVPVIRKKRLTPLFPLTPLYSTDDIATSVVSDGTLEYAFEIPLCEFTSEEMRTSTSTMDAALSPSTLGFEQRPPLKLADEHRYYEGALVRVSHGVEIVVSGEVRGDPHQIATAHHTVGDGASWTRHNSGISGGTAVGSNENGGSPEESPHNATMLFKDFSMGTSSFNATSRTNAFSTVSAENTPRRLNGTVSTLAPSPDDCRHGAFPSAHNHSLFHGEDTHTSNENPLSSNDDNELFSQTVYSFQLTSAAAASGFPSSNDLGGGVGSTSSFRSHLSGRPSALVGITDHRDCETASNATLPPMHHHADPHIKHTSSGFPTTPSTTTVSPTTTLCPTPFVRPVRVTRQFHSVSLDVVNMTYSKEAISRASEVSHASPPSPSPMPSAHTSFGNRSSTGVDAPISRPPPSTATKDAFSDINSLYDRVRSFHELHEKEGYLQPYAWDGKRLSLHPTSHHHSAAVSLSSATKILQELRPFFDPCNNETFPVVSHKQILLMVPEEAVTVQVSHYATKKSAMSVASSPQLDTSEMYVQDVSQRTSPVVGSIGALPFTVKSGTSSVLQNDSIQLTNPSATSSPLGCAAKYHGRGFSDNSGATSPCEKDSAMAAGLTKSTDPQPPPTTRPKVSAVQFCKASTADSLPRPFSVADLGPRTQSTVSLLSEASTDTSWRRPQARPRLHRLLSRNTTRMPKNPTMYLYAAPPGTVAVYPEQPQGNIPIGPSILMTYSPAQNFTAPAANGTATAEETAAGGRCVEVSYYVPRSLDADGGAQYHSGVSTNMALKQRLHQEKLAL